MSSVDVSKVTCDQSGQLDPSDLENKQYPRRAARTLATTDTEICFSLWIS
jgi:hypothetical protein